LQDNPLETFEGKSNTFTDPRDSTRTNTSRFSSCIAILARIKEREDMVDSSSRYRFHEGV